MKLKYILLPILAVLLGLSAPLAASAYDEQRPVYVNVNGQRIDLDTSPMIINGRTLIPVRPVFEKMGAEVIWNGTECSVTVKYKDSSVKVWIYKKKALVNGTVKYMDVEPTVKNGRTLVPVRFISENLGLKVGWYYQNRLVTVTDPAEYNRVPDKAVLGYTTNDYRGDNNSYNSLTSNINNVDVVATFSYAVDRYGYLSRTGESQQNTVQLARSQDKKTFVLIHNMVNGKFDGTIAHSVLSNSLNRKRLIDQTLLIMAKEGYSGVNIDLEGVYWYDRSSYSALIKELRQRLSGFGYMVTVSIPAKTNDDKQNSWSGAFDYVEIGKYADLAAIMTYDEHYFGGTPGPIASYPWIRKVMGYAVNTMPRSRILMGVPGYGYDWASSGNKVLSFANAEGLIRTMGVQPLWDSTARSPYFSYSLNGTGHEVWYENAESLSEKLDIVNEYDIAGISIWKLGYDNETFWQVINAKLQ